MADLLWLEEFYVTRQNKAIKLTEDLIKDLQKLVISEKGMSIGNLETTILRLCEIINLIK